MATTITSYILGITYLKIFLEKSKTLQCLNVSYNSIGNDGVKCIKDGLEQNNSLTKLNISSCGVKGMYTYHIMVKHSKGKLS